VAHYALLQNDSARAQFENSVLIRYLTASLQAGKLNEERPE